MTDPSRKANRKYPSIPGVSGDVQSHTRALQAIKESIEIHERRVSNAYLDSFVSLRDLKDLGVIKIRGNQLVLGDNIGTTSTSDGGGDGVTDHGELTGLGHNDHPQYVLGATLTADGDIFIRSGGSVSRLPIGNEGQVLTVSSGGLPAWEDAAGGGESSDLETEILADSPVGYWKCDEDSGTTLADSSGNSFDLTLNGTYTLAEAFLVNLDEKHVYIDTAGEDGASRSGALGLTTPLDGDWTIEFVTVPAESDDEAFFAITGDGESEDTNIQAWAVLSGGDLQVIWERGSGTNETTLTNFTLEAGVRYHVVIVKDSSASTLTFYVNGVRARVESYSNEPTGGGNVTTYLGADGGNSNGAKHIGHVAFYNTALSWERVATHARAAGLF